MPAFAQMSDHGLAEGKAYLYPSVFLELTALGAWAEAPQVFSE
jgi:hypothetical protein